MIRHRDRQSIPVVNSEYLFRRLSSLYEVNLVCDVGSFDGTHALRFCRPGVRVMALEANPINADALAANREISEAGIEVFHLAACDEDGYTSFNIVKVPPQDSEQWRAEISSIRDRVSQDVSSRSAKVPATRLDTFVSGLRSAKPLTVALWIDVEGAGFEVLEGILGIRDEVCVIHIEVETERFWQQQRLLPDVLMLMRGFGFSPLARSQGGKQFDVVFVNDTFYRKVLLVTQWRILTAWARYRAGRALGFARKYLPGNTGE